MDDANVLRTPGAEALPPPLFGKEGAEAERKPTALAALGSGTKFGEGALSALRPRGLGEVPQSLDCWILWACPLPWGSYTVPLSTHTKDNPCPDF